MSEQRGYEQVGDINFPHPDQAGDGQEQYPTFRDSEDAARQGCTCLWDNDFHTAGGICVWIDYVDSECPFHGATLPTQKDSGDGG